MLLTYLSLREERTFCPSSGITRSGLLLHPLLESFASMTSHLLSSLPLHINRPIPGKHPQTITTSPLTTHFYLFLGYSLPLQPQLVIFHSASCLACTILKCIFCANTFFFQWDYKLLEGRDHALFCVHIPSKTYTMQAAQNRDHLRDCELRTLASCGRGYLQRKSSCQ